jgi:hypothetical protein
VLEQLDPVETAAILKNDIVLLLSKDPHCPIANLLGRALMDLYEQHYNALTD